MTATVLPSSQIRVERVSYAPCLFRALKPKQQPLSETAPPLLQEVSFEVFPGDRVAIVGASGAGKTTLLRLLNRLYEPTAGQLYWGERPYTALSPVQLRQQIPLILQESKLMEMTVQDAIAYPLTLRGIGKQEITQRVADWMERLRIPLEWRDRTEQQLSVGQRQLVAIARALVIEPPILLCDEPTSALDVGRSQQVLDLLKTLSETRQMTVIMVNHQLDLVNHLATRVLQLHKGRLIADQPATTIHWAELEQNLKRVEQEAADEWR